jgi:hypothetical protein
MKSKINKSIVHKIRAAELGNNTLEIHTSETSIKLDLYSLRPHGKLAFKIPVIDDIYLQDIIFVNISYFWITFKVIGIYNKSFFVLESILPIINTRDRKYNKINIITKLLKMLIKDKVKIPQNWKRWLVENM